LYVLTLKKGIIYGKFSSQNVL